jgi:DNA-binding transcriptional MocR family regulator
MAHTIAVDTGGPVPLVTQIFEAMAEKIDNGDLRGGARLPSVRRLAEQCGVSTLTVSNAYNRLVAQGYLEARRANGYFVSGRPRPMSRQSEPRKLPPRAASVDSLWLLQRVYEDEKAVLRPGCGWLPESLVFADGIKQALTTVAKKPNVAFTRYGNPLGYAPLRRQIQLLLAHRHIDCDAKRIVLTQGASQALDLAARALLQPGDTALVDDPGYCNLFPALWAMGVKMVGVERTPQGPDLYMLELLARQHRPKVFFTNTNLHNPTGTSCSPAVVYRILRLAEECDFHVVEDDFSADLVAETTQSVASLDQLRRVIYIGSFSKSISPTLRVGFLAGNDEVVERVLYHKMAGGLTSSELTEQVAHAILVEGHHRRHLARLCERLTLAQETVCKGLASAGLTIFHRPSGGMFVWAGFGLRTDVVEVAKQAAAKGIMLAPGYLFRPDQQPTPWLRFNVAQADDPRLYRFLDEVSSRHAEE